MTFGPQLAMAIALIGVMAAAGVFLWRVLRGPSTPNRLLAAHGLMGVGAVAVALAGVVQADHRVLLGACVLAVLGPIAIHALAARFGDRAPGRGGGDA